MCLPWYKVLGLRANTIKVMPKGIRFLTRDLELKLCVLNFVGRSIFFLVSNVSFLSSPRTQSLGYLLTYRDLVFIVV